MVRKTKQINEELTAQATKLQELQKLKEEAEKEEKEKIESVTKQVEQIGIDNGMFIGVILTKQDLLAVLDMALSTGENVTIPARAYFKD
jgi:aspartokinase